MHNLRVKICRDTGINSHIEGDTIKYEGEINKDEVSVELKNSLINIVSLILGEDFKNNIKIPTNNRSRNNTTGACLILENSEDDISDDDYKLLKESIFFFFDTITNHSKKKLNSRIISDALPPALSNSLLKESDKFLLRNGEKKITKPYRIEFAPHEDMNLGTSFLTKPGSIPNRETKEVIEGRVISLTKKVDDKPMKCTILLVNKRITIITLIKLDHYKLLHQMMEHDNNRFLVFETTRVINDLNHKGILELDNITNIPDPDSFTLDVQ